MAVEDAADLAVFFDADDFGEEASITIGGAAAVTVSGQFNADHAIVLEGVGGGVTTTAPMFTCAAADVSGVSNGDGVVVGGESYTVADHQPEGDGAVIKLVLEEV